MRVETVEIKKIGINGEGIGYIDRKIVFVKGALVGEEVEISITKSNRNYYEGEIRHIKNTSSDRVKPYCSKEKECQGCSLLHMKYTSQLKYKKEAIRESIRKYTSYDLKNTVFKDVMACKPLEGFISTINVPIVSMKERITFGIYQRESKHLTVLTNCFKQDQRINVCLKRLEDILTKHQCKTYNDKTKLGLRFLKVKLIDNDIQLVFITGKDGLSEKVIEDIKTISDVKGLFVSTNTSRYQDFEEVGYTKVFGNTRLDFQHHGKKYLVSVKSKLADNFPMYLKRNEEITKMAYDSEKILSLHCGIGLLELNMDKEIVAIDEKNYHIEDAKLNQKWAKKENINFVRGDIDDKVTLYAKKKEYDTFVVQNGRFGMSDAVKDSIRLSKVNTVIYVCESHSTLAKDIAELEKYYRLEKIVALDSAAYTPYVTTIVRLKRK
ncbi:MAG: TRAM domain-containing protein [Coprobacillaceae bacterium]